MKKFFAGAVIGGTLVAISSVIISILSFISGMWLVWKVKENEETTRYYRPVGKPRTPPRSVRYENQAGETPSS